MAAALEITGPAGGLGRITIFGKFAIEKLSGFLPVHDMTYIKGGLLSVSLFRELSNFSR